MKKYALIVAGGKGLRMGSDTPKQFLLLANKPILVHTIQAFEAIPDVKSITLVLPSAQLSLWKKISKNYSFSLPIELVEGGATRYESVNNGLKNIKEGLVAIHDGVRPLVASALIQRTFAAAAEHAGCIPALPLTDSLRKYENGDSITCERSKYVIVQTPQTFQTNIIKTAYAKVKDSPLITDDASVFEMAGNKIYLVDGQESNLKITTKMDLAIAETFLKEIKKASAS